MRFVSVKAVAFGALSGQELQLAPRLNVVYGPNESGKSTWHDALYAGLCGMRRGAGRTRKEDEEFRSRRQPWGSEEFAATVRIELADRRSMEVRQDLAGRVDCKVTDVVLGRDHTDEVVFDGSPDGSRFVGLDRGAFRSTACVRQAELLEVLNERDRLQEHLQRAADTAGRDSTAAGALERIEEYKREHVGTDRLNSTKPLRAAMNRLADTERALDEATAKHQDLLRLRVRADEQEAVANRARAAWNVVRFALARDKAVRERASLDRARDLAAQVPEGGPIPVSQEDSLAVRVATAVQAWENRPDPAELGGPTAEELQKRLEALPAEPAGDLEPHPAVVAARREYDGARDELERLQVPLAPAGGRRAGRSPLSAVALAVALGLIGMAAMTPSWRPATITGGVGALVLAIWLFLRSSRPGPGTTAGNGRDQDVLSRVKASRLRLSEALVSRGMPGGVDVGGAFEEYREQCAKRHGQAERSQRREDLLSQLPVRRRAEQKRADDVDRRQAAEKELRDVARACGITSTDDGDLVVERLRGWQAARRGRVEQASKQRSAVDELKGLLEGRTLEAFEEEVENLETEAKRLSDELSSDGPAIPDGADLHAEENVRHEEWVTAQRDAGKLRTQVAERSRDAVSVPDAEEDVERAKAELSRVRGLERVLDSAARHLREAEDRVHRDIAPRLASALRARLPDVTGGRYIDAIVDPATLDVTVQEAGGDRRPATGLSHGTTEMVYLFLRVALVEHLTKAGEVCPLLLDDVTVQCDRERTARILDVLRELAKERQIILFSQEDEVLAWARENLDPEQGDRLHELTPVPVGSR